MDADFVIVATMEAVSKNKIKIIKTKEEEEQEESHTPSLSIAFRHPFSKLCQNCLHQ